MPRSVRGKLWRKFTSLFRRRKRKYDVIAAANREIRPFDFVTGADQTTDLSMSGNIPLVTNSHYIPFLRGKTYEVAATESLDDQQPPIHAGTYRRSVHFVRQSHLGDNSTTEQYVAALFREGLLQWPYASRNPADPLCIPEVRDYPVLAVCYGFRDKELRENCKRPNQRQPLPLDELDSSMESWVQSGIDQVMVDELTGEETRVDDIPVSMWMSVIEPALHTLMTYRLGRSKRLNITTKRQQTPMNSLHLSTVGGDSEQHDLLPGPPNQHWALGLVAVFTMRIGELGERQLRHRDLISDIRIPDLNSKTRRRNRIRAKTTRTAAVTRDTDFD